MTSSKPGPSSRRERPAKPALSRDGIVATAVALLRAEGLERVTMRRLATELDTGAASLYVYVRNTAELHAAVLDQLLGLLETLLAQGQVAPDRAAWAVDLLLQHATTTAAEQGIRRAAPDAEDEDDALADALADAVHGASPTSHPRIAALGADLLSGPVPARLTWGFEVLINGVLITARPAAASTTQED